MAEEKSCSISEYLESIREVYAHYKDTIHTSICGLAEYAGVLAAAGRNEDLADLRGFTRDMAAFWFSEDDVREDGSRSCTWYEGRIDGATEAARRSGQTPGLRPETLRDVLEGLDLYAEEMEATGDLEKDVDACHAFAARLQSEWAGPEMTMGGM